MRARVFALTAVSALFLVGVVLFLQLGVLRPDLTGELAKTFAPDRDDSAATEFVSAAADAEGEAGVGTFHPLTRGGVTRDGENVPVAAVPDSTSAAQVNADALPPLFDEPAYCHQDPPALDIVAAYAYLASLTDEQRSRCRAHGVLQAATEKGLKFSELPPEDRILFEERDPVWATDTENALINLIPQLEGVTFTSFKAECKSTICTVDFIMRPTDSSQGKVIPSLNRQIVRLSKEIGLVGELTAGSARDGNWWFLAAFARPDVAAVKQLSN